MAHNAFGSDDNPEPGRVKADTQIGTAAYGQLGFLKNQLDKYNDPMSFWNQEKSRITSDIKDQKRESAEQFGIEKQLATDAFSQTAAQGQMTQDRLIEQQHNETRRLREASNAQAEETRASAMEESYAASLNTGGMASSGGRQRKALSKKLQRSMERHNQELSSMLEQSREAVAKGEETMQMARSNEAQSLAHKNIMGQKAMADDRAALDRKLAGETARIDQEVSAGKDALEKEAGQLVSQTVGSFLSSNSTWANRVPEAKNWREFMGIEEEEDTEG